MYGYSWYLDAVLPQPDWKWVGLVLPDEAGGYRAVMPVPLRRKFGVWQVHQPFFCQMVRVFCANPAFDPTKFFQAVYKEFRYGAVLHVSQPQSSDLRFGQAQQRSTHVLDLSAGYETIYQKYTADRRRNLRVAQAGNWILSDSTNSEPLLAIFRTNHANSIDGVADWAYDILRNLIVALQSRGLAVLRYASLDGNIEAGALFVREGHRIIYLFNASSAAGRRGNARTLLIDQIIQEYAQRAVAERIPDEGPVWFDFESPEKRSIRAFYESFGAVPQPFWAVRWNRLSWPERLGLTLVRRYLTAY